MKSTNLPYWLDVQHYWRQILLTLVAVGALIALLLQDPIGQNPAYHSFADQRIVLGIPHFFDVVSNLPFALFGLLGLAYTRRNRRPQAPTSWTVFFSGVTLVCIGSAYYHLSPSNDTLVWDRLPMTVAFMGLFVGLLAEYVDDRIERRLLWPAIGLGIASVAYWHVTDDLRLYVWIQAVPLVIILAVLLTFRNVYTRQRFLLLALLCYLLAKVTEYYDKEIFGLTSQLVSGHTLKHLLAATAALALSIFLKKRTRLLVRNGP